MQKCTAPVVIFHGNKDEVIYYGSSLKLKEENSKIRLITLKNQGHNGMSDNKEYRKALQKLLTRKIHRFCYDYTTIYLLSAR